MKIVAQSLVPPKLTYLHLAYVAAINYRDNSTSAALAMFSGVITTCTIIICLAIVTYQSIKHARLWKPVITLIAGLIIIVSVLVHAYTYKMSPEVITKAHMEGLFNSLQFCPPTNNTSPGNIRKMLHEMNIDDKRMYDGWKHGLRATRLKRVIKYKNNLIYEYRVTSAGPDGKFGTRDDITYQPK